MFVLKALYWGLTGVRRNYELQIRNIVEAGYRSLGERPVIIGECGIPVDMKYVEDYLPAKSLFTRVMRIFSAAEAFRTGDFKWQERMMDAMMSALERNLISFK